MYRAVALTFSDQFRRWREDAGLTQAGVATGLGIKQQTVSDWERGRALPTVTRAGQIAGLLQVPVDEFLRALSAGPGEVTHVGEDSDADGDDLLEVTTDFNSKVARLSVEDQKYIDDLIERLLRERR